MSEEAIDSMAVIHDGRTDDGESIYLVRCPACEDEVRDGRLCSCGYEWSIELKAIGRRWVNAQIADKPRLASPRQTKA